MSTVPEINVPALNYVRSMWIGKILSKFTETRDLILEQFSLIWGSGAAWKK